MEGHVDDQRPGLEVYRALLEKENATDIESKVQECRKALGSDFTIKELSEKYVKQITEQVKAARRQNRNALKLKANVQIAVPEATDDVPRPSPSAEINSDMPAPEQNGQVAKNVSPDNHEYKLFYPNMKGLAEPVRMLFKAAGQDFEDIRVTPQQWKSMNSKYEFGDLPVLQIDGQQLAKPNAIMRYMSKKFQMAGKDDFESYKIDELADELIDFRSEWRKFFMEKDPEKKKALKMILEEATVPKYLGRLEELKKVNGGKFLVGEKLSWVDLQYANSFELFEAMLPGIMDAYPSLKQLQKNVLEIPEIKEWIRIRPATQF